MKQTLPAADYRVDTGPLKIGEDWCGYFFRGDEMLMGHCQLLDYISSLLADSHPAIAGRLRREIDAFRACAE